VSIVELPGNPFQAVPTGDGCHVFVSLVGPVEPGDPRRPAQPGAPKGGVAVVSRVGEPSLTRVVTVEGSPYGMALTHDGRLLIVASDDRVAFIDVGRLIVGSDDAILGYLNDAPLAGRAYANVTADDRWLFLSDESTRSITVVDLRKARASGFDGRAVVGQIPVLKRNLAGPITNCGRNAQRERRQSHDHRRSSQLSRQGQFPTPTSKTSAAATGRLRAGAADCVHACRRRQNFRRCPRAG
jgi:hypothetical protein